MVVAVTPPSNMEEGRSNKHVFVDTEGDIEEMLDLTDIRWRTSKLRSAAGGTTAKFPEHLSKMPTAWMKSEG